MPSIFNCAIFEPEEFRWLVRSGILRSARPGVILRCPSTGKLADESESRIVDACSTVWGYNAGCNEIGYVDIPLEPPSDEVVE